MKTSAQTSSKSWVQQAQIHQLQEEIDKLALLMSEVRKQSARIQAAADALGDAALLNPATGLISFPRAEEQ